MELSLNKPDNFETAESNFGAITRYSFQSFLLIKRQ